MQTVLILLAVASVSAARFAAFSGHGQSHSSSGSSEAHGVVGYGNGYDNGFGGYHGDVHHGFAHAAPCDKKKVIRHKPKVHIKHRRFVVNHPQRVTKITKKVTCHKHVVHRLPKVFKKVVVQQKVRKFCRKLPLHGVKHQVVGSSSSASHEFAHHPKGKACGHGSSSSSSASNEWKGQHGGKFIGGAPHHGFAAPHGGVHAW